MSCVSSVALDLHRSGMMTVATLTGSEMGWPMCPWPIASPLIPFFFSLKVGAKTIFVVVGS